MNIRNKDEVLQNINGQQTINGFQFMKLVLPVRPTLTLHFALLFFIGIVGFVSYLLGLLSSDISISIFVKIISIICGFEFIVMLGYLSSIEILGQSYNLALRLLLTLAETRLAIGYWMCLLSAAVCSLSGIPEWLGLNKRSDSNVYDDLYQY